MSPHASLEPGTILDGRFRVERLLGRGGYGEVYEGVQMSMHRAVAIKTLRANVAGDPTTIERFQNEARFACQLNHPNTVHYYDFGFDEAQGVIFLVMEYLAGETLAQRLKDRGPLSLDEMTVILEQICGSLAEAHSVGLVHRDVKPENVMLIERAGRANYVKVIDFGIAKAIEPVGAVVSEGLTATGTILGSPHYMAPEQIRSGEFPIDRRVDVYALGCMVFKALTGVPPFRGRSPMDIATRHLIDPAPSLSSVMSSREFPAPLEELMQASLSKVPEERPTTALVFYERYLEAVGDVLHTPPHLLIKGATPPPARRPAKPTVMGQISAVDRDAGEVDLSNARAKKEVQAARDDQSDVNTVHLPPTDQSDKPSGTRGVLVALVSLAGVLLLAGAAALLLADGGEAPPDPAEDAGVVVAEDAPEAEDTPTPSASGEGDVSLAQADAAVPPKEALPPEPDGEAAGRVRRRRRAASMDKDSVREVLARHVDKKEEVDAEVDERAPKEDREPAARQPEKKRDKPAPRASAPIDVNIVVQPWGKIVVGGKSGESRLRVPLKPGRHQVSIHQYGKVVHRKSIDVQPGRTSFTIAVPRN